jgi:hypothetical protein
MRWHDGPSSELCNHQRQWRGGTLTDQPSDRSPEINQQRRDRTNGHSAKAGLERELAQTLDMLLTLANLYGVDVFVALYDWMAEVEERGKVQRQD